eukprot:CAMPEP_0176020168 /NCGR_PEP_ID=MMETSP0120_2-20121206/9763_1 /TAXON_ID=160619 /ORGANISM="Kryptoperidinium foliaceum, Strain CCMP 1326" /LENGTH=35 /DNA_ID= /DNA_START= /DNA_END= /DNA_ORIENTATION=
MTVLPSPMESHNKPPRQGLGGGGGLAMAAPMRGCT